MVRTLKNAAVSSPNLLEKNSSSNIIEYTIYSKVKVKSVLSTRPEDVPLHTI